MKIKEYLALLDDAEQSMNDAFELLATRYAADADIHGTAQRLAAWSVEKREALRPAIERYGRARTSDTERINDALFRQPRIGGFGQVRDIHDAALLVHHVFLCWTAIEQAAQARFDRELVELAKRELVRTERQVRWLRTLFKNATPQALTIDPEKASELKATLHNLKQRLSIPAAAMLAAGAVAFVAALATRALRAS